MVLAEHFEVHAERGPAHAEIGLPLHLYMAAGHRQREFLAGRILERHGPLLSVYGLHRHIEHFARVRMDWQERAVGRLTLLAQRGQHHIHDVLIFPRGLQQHGVEPAGFVTFRGRQEFILESELVEEGTEPRIHVRAIGIMRAERVRHSRQRLLQVRLQLFRVRHGRRHFAHPVHVIRHTDQARCVFAAGQHFKGVTHHRRAHDFAKRADMRQAGRAITGLEGHRVASLTLAGLDLLLHALFQLAGKLERPGLSGMGERGEIGHRKCLSLLRNERSAGPRGRRGSGQAVRTFL